MCGRNEERTADERGLTRMAGGFIRGYPDPSPVRRSSDMSLLIKNGEIVTADSRYVADIWCEGETITRIDRDIAPAPGTEVIDATGKLVFPGFIDPHVHIYLPFMGTFSKDTYETGSKAELVVSTTSLIEMCFTVRKEDAYSSVDHCMSLAVLNT